MLSERGDWVEMVEINPPRLPSMTHRDLKGRWDRVLITDNPFKQVRVSPYAFAARITHDVPGVRPTVVCSTRDRNILAIEHWSNSYEIVEHLRELQQQTPTFEVGMSTRSRRWMMQRRIEVGAQFLTTGPVMDPASVEAVASRIGLREEDPPVSLELTPPFSLAWVRRLENVGAIAVSEEVRTLLESTPEDGLRELGWRLAKGIAARARTAGFAGVVIMGLRYETAVGEGFDAWHDDALAPLDPRSAA